MTISLECDTQELFDEQTSELEEEIEIRPCWQLRELFPSDCGTKAYGYKFQGRVLYDPYRDGSAGHKKLCPFCARGDASRKAKQAYHRIMAFEWSNMWGITLTTDQDFVTRYESPRKAKDALMKLGQKYMKTFHPDVPFMIAFHHWKTNDPLGGWHYHLHITAVCASYRFEEEGGLIDKEIDPYVDLKQARQVWGKILKLDKTPDLHYQFISRHTRRWFEDGEEIRRGGSQKIRHWLNYVYRYYIQDVEKFLRKEENQKLILEREDEESIYRHNGDWGRRISSYGAWSNRKRKYFIKEDIVNKRIAEMQDIERKVYDPITGTPLQGKGKLVSLGRSRFKKSELVARYTVRYIDYPAKIENFVVFLKVPCSCMRWTEYHSFKRKKKK